MDGRVGGRADEGSERTSGQEDGRAHRWTRGRGRTKGGRADEGGRAYGRTDDRFPKVKLLI